MRQLLLDTRFDFMGKRKIAAMISAAAILVSLVSLIAHGGPKLGIDFQGGTLVQILVDEVVRMDDVRGALSDAGIEGAEIQHIASEYGNNREILIRMKHDPSVDPFGSIKAAVLERIPDVELDLRRQETVGPKIGKELRSKAVWANACSCSHSSASPNCLSRAAIVRESTASCRLGIAQALRSTLGR